MNIDTIIRLAAEAVHGLSTKDVRTYGVFVAELAVESTFCECGKSPEEHAAKQFCFMLECQGMGNCPSMGSCDIERIQNLITTLRNGVN